MISRTTPQFWQRYARLPAGVREEARRAYRLWVRNPAHPSLRFKKLEQKGPLWSVRIGLHYRALATRDGENVVWVWIGTHAEYDRIIR